MGLRAFPFILACAICSAAEPSAGELRAPATIAAGRKLYTAACSGCHGSTGEGGRGPNLSDGVLIRRTRNDRLFTSIHRGVPGTDMPGFPMPEDRIWSIVAYLRSLSAPAIEASLAGDPTEGRALFNQKKCSDCHMIRGQGGYLGPDLTNAGATRTVKQLRESIADPNARIADGFRRVEVITADGKMLKGVAKNHNNYSVQMLTPDGKLHLLDIAQLKDIKLEQMSPMPEMKLSKQELDALVAFLSTQAVRQ